MAVLGGMAEGLALVAAEDVSEVRMAVAVLVELRRLAATVDAVDVVSVKEVVVVHGSCGTETAVDVAQSMRVEVEDDEEGCPRCPAI